MLTKEKAFEFIASCKSAVIASVDADGYPNQKAMLAPRKIDGNMLYFTTNTSSMRVGQYRGNDKASVYFFAKGRFKYQGLMLVGRMEVLEDEDIKREIWRFGDTMFYRKGVTDPDYCVLKFTAEKCRYYCDLKTYWIDLDWTL